MPSCLGIIGCGNMANAIVKGLSKDKAGFQDILVNDINQEKALAFAREYGVKAVDYETLWKECNTVILAVKPYQVKEVLNAGRGHWHPDQLIISIAAGIKLASMEVATDNLLPVIRVMPNTPCLVGQGIAAVAVGSKAAEADIDIVMHIFNSLGTIVKIDEKYMDAVTAVSGSGPAYVFLVVEAFMNAALQIGLDINLARELVIETMKGSLEMLEQSGEHPAVLRQDVSSPGGTTIAGIRQLEENGIRKAFFDAVEMAYNRSIELSSDD
ncbi:MAG: pyrroline-5-carboxylate reductase [Syntrophomonadaceae bacterium]|nr:pyrroline-5-carboxylate reductase [Syntrophomonadaceae bacterium]